MAITYPLTWPASVVPRSMRLIPNDAVAQTKAPTSFADLALACEVVAWPMLVRRLRRG